MLFDQGQLEKMTITAYLPTSCDDDVPTLSPAKKDSYTVQVNPSSYTFSSILNYSKRQGQGDSASDSVFSSSQPTTMSFDFVWDATGVVPPPSALGGIPVVGAIASALSGDKEYVIMDQIKNFSLIVYDYSGEIHRPRKVQLRWGTLVFSCVLESVSYEFKLFKPDGTPLRVAI